MKYDVQRIENFGYLVWIKIPYEYLTDPNLGALLERDLSTESDPYLVKLHKSKELVFDAILTLSGRDIKRIRTGLSWAEWDAPYGQIWISWYMRLLAKHFKVLADVAFTPPHKSINGKTSAPPRDLSEFPKFIWSVLVNVGDLIDEIELSNEWDLETDWDLELDPRYEKFITMITMGALVLRHFGKRVVLGGMSGVKPITLETLSIFAQAGLCEFVDALGFHNLRGTWSDDQPPKFLDFQAQSVGMAGSQRPSEESITSLISRMVKEAKNDEELTAIFENARSYMRSEKISVYLTEYGFPPIGPASFILEEELEKIQVALFAYSLREVLEGRLERVYWYTYRDDKSPSLRFHITNWEDFLQHAYGDTHDDGRAKLLGRLLREGGIPRVLEYAMEHDLWHLIEKASLKRERPWDYKSQSQSRP